MSCRSVGWFRSKLFSSCRVFLQNPDSKMMQINLTGFLNGKNAREFMGELWPLLLSAQENIAGIPSAFLELKKEEIKQRQVITPFILMAAMVCGLVVCLKNFCLCSLIYLNFGDLARLRFAVMFVH